MTAAVQQFLDTFDTQPDADKHHLAIEILRRVSVSIEGDLSEEALIGAADQLFLALDAEADCQPMLNDPWRQEIARRSSEYDAGEAETLTWQEVQTRWQSRRTDGG